MADEDALYEEYMSGDVDYYPDEYYDDMINETETIPESFTTTTVVPQTPSTTPVATTTEQALTTTGKTVKKDLPDFTEPLIIPNRFFDLLNRKPTTERTTVKTDLETDSAKTRSETGPSRATLPFISRPRPGGRPSLLPPRKSIFRVPPPPRKVTSDPRVINDTKSTTRVTQLPSLRPFTTTTTTISTPLGLASFIDKIKSKKDNEKTRLKAVEELEADLSFKNDEFENLVFNDEVVTKKTTPAPKLPDIPEEVMSLLPLGIDPTLASGKVQKYLGY